MYDFDETVEHYSDSYDANKVSLKYLRRCRTALTKIAILNNFFDLADSALIKEARSNTRIYIREVKEDRFYLKLMAKIIKKLYINGVDEFEYDFVALLKCIEMKDINLSQVEAYYIEKIKSHVNRYGYIGVKQDDRIEEFNGKITELVRRLHKNALDYNG